MAGLLADLSLKISANTAELNTGLNKAKNSVNKFGKDTKKSGGAIKKSFDGLAGGAKNLASNIANQFGLAGGAIGTLASSFTGAFSALKGLTTGMNVFKVALASTGIGLLVVALGALYTYFTSTQQGADGLSKAMAGVKAVFAVVTDTLGEFGGALVNAFSNPMETLKGFGESIKKFILSRIELLISGVKGIGTAFKQLFAGEFEAAAKTAGTSLLDITRATSPVAMAIEGMAGAMDSVIGKYGEASEEAKKAYKLQEDAIALEKSNLKLKIDAANYELELSDLIRKSKEKENFTEAERLDFIKQAQAIQDKLSKAKIAAAQEELRIKVETDKLANNMRSDDEETVDLQVSLIKLKKEANDKQRELVNRVNEAGNALGVVQREQQKVTEALAEEAALRADMANIPNLSAMASIKINEEESASNINSTLSRLGAMVQPVNIPIIPNLDSELFAEQMITFSEQLTETMGVISEKINTVTNQIGAAFGAVMNKKKAELDNYYSKEKKAIEDSRMSEETKAKAMQQLDEKVSKKRGELAKKGAKMEKLQAIVGASVNTALAITKAIAASPLTGGLPFSAIAAALGATQIAAIASTPLPTFANGGIVEGATTGDRNLIRANGGEMILNKGQQEKMFNMINSNIGGNGSRSNEATVIKIKGEDLYIALNEYERRQLNTY